MPPIRVHRDIFHHCQDTGSNCGRTCAQMVISSLAQSPGQGDSFPPPAAGTAIVTQGALQSRETESSDTVTVPQWFTHPDELVALLANEPQFTQPFQRNWRVANHASRPDLLADVALALQRGMPSLVTMDGSDHWVVVIGTTLDAAGLMDGVRMLNPLPVDARPHTYVDACSDSSNGESYGEWPLTGPEFGGYDLEVGPVAPPSGMTNYSGRFVGIINGPTAVANKLREIAKRFKPPKRPPWEPGEPVLDPTALVRELRRKAVDWEITHLLTLLDHHPSSVVRPVKDAEGSAAQYTLLSLFSTELEQGVIAAFRPSGAVMHFQFVKDPLIDASLRRSLDGTLWWTRNWLPSLHSPYFPFERKPAGDQLVYTRLFDGYEFKSPA